MENLILYFDPACPWAWRGYLWAREVRAHGPVTLQPKIFSLREIHRQDDEAAAGLPVDPVLRVLALARRQGGDEALERLYLALGQARHERRENLSSEGVVEAALAEAGLDRSLRQQALDDPTTADDVLAEHNEAVKKYEAFGVPYLVLDGQSFGFYGPIISEVPRGDAAMELWQHTAWILKQPYLWEFKRDRP